MAAVIIASLIISCNGRQGVKTFIEGSYMRNFENEFAVGIDSVVLLEQGDNHYLILKYSRFSRLKNGDWLPEERHEEKMAGVYDEDKEIINEQKKGKVIHFNPAKGKMFIGASEYKKVK